jgi:Putative zinc-finger
MDHTRINDDQVPERYVLGRLPDEDRYRFEEHLVGCEGCIAAVEAAEGLRDGLKDASVRDGAAAGAAPPPVVRQGPWPARPLVTLLAAACVPVAVLSALFFAQAGQARREAEGARQALAQLQRRQAELEGTLGSERADQARAAGRADSLKAAPVFMLNLTRGVSDEPEDRVVLPDAPGWVTLVFDRPERRGVRDYRVRVSSADGRPVGAAASARAAGESLLAVSVPSERLPAGDYVLEVEGLTAGEPVPLARYRFRANGKP